MGQVIKCTLASPLSCCGILQSFFEGEKSGTRMDRLVCKKSINNRWTIIHITSLFLWLYFSSPCMAFFPLQWIILVGEK